VFCEREANVFLNWDYWKERSIIQKGTFQSNTKLDIQNKANFYYYNGLILPLSSTMLILKEASKWIFHGLYEFIPEFFFVFFMPLIDVLKFIPAHQNHQRIIESQWRWLLIQFLLFLLRWIKLWDNIPVYINKTNTYLYLKIISQNFYIKLLKETNCKI